MSLQPVLNGATSSYALITDLLNARDWAQIADWCAPSTQTRGTLAEVLADTLPNTPGILNAKLQFAGGLIEAATLKGNMYQLIDLQALIYQPPAYTARLTAITNSGQMLIEMNSWLAIMALSRRKTRVKTDDNMIDWAIGMLDSLEKGERIFSLAAVSDAGLAEVIDYAPRYSQQYFDRPSIQAIRMFGHRGRGWGHGGFGE
jgi:hypothetical protein